MKQLKLAIFALIVIFTSACTTLKKTHYPYTVKRDQVFKTVDGMSLKGDFYLPKREGKRIAILVAHGGGWARRSGDMEALCRQLAEAGFVAFNTTYRLAPKNRHPKAAEDVRDAAIWLKEQASVYNFDSEKIAGWGYSAGAHLILLAGLDSRNGLKALVAGGSPADLTVWPKSEMVRDLIGKYYAEDEAAWKDASPVFHVKPDSPPVFLYHGQWDMLVQVEQMYKMRDALQKQNVPVKTHKVYLLGHVPVYLWSQQSIDLGMQFIEDQFRERNLSDLQ